MTDNINLPMLLAVSSGWLPAIDKTLRGFQPADDCQQVAYRPGKPIELGANEPVPFSDIIEGRIKLLTLGHRRHLLAENLFAPGSAKVALLRLQAGYLSQ